MDSNLLRTALTSFLQAMNSLNRSSPPTTFLCPRLRYKNQMDPKTYYIEKRNYPYLEESHHLFPCDTKLEKRLRNFFSAATGMLNFRMELFGMHHSTEFQKIFTSYMENLLKSIPHIPKME